MTRRLVWLAAAATFVAGAGLAAARPIKPDEAHRPCEPEPQQPLLEVVESDSSFVDAVVHEHQAAIWGCALEVGLDKPTVLHVTLAWNRRGVIHAVNVRGRSRPAFRRCVSRALRGVMPVKVHRGGRGSANVVVRPGSLLPSCIPPPDTTILSPAHPPGVGPARGP